MTTLRVWLSRLRGALRGRSRAEAELADEVQTHLDLLAHDFVARGMSPEEARFAARRAFGGVDQAKALYRDQLCLPAIDGLAQDVRFSCRSLTRDSSFLVTAVLVLSLGIGVTHMFLTIVYAHTMRGLPIPRPDRILYISTFDDRTADRPMSYPDFDDLRAGASRFQELVAYTSTPVAIGDDGRAPDRLEASFVSAGAFATLGITPLAGRDFAPADHRPGAAPVVMLGRSAWLSRYRGDPGVIGREILVDGAPATVTGILPDRSGFPSTASVWLPLEHSPGLVTAPRDARGLRVFGRLDDDSSEADARADVASIMSRLEAQHPTTNRGVRGRVVPINERFLGRLEGPWLAFLIAGCIIVLVSSANAANLVLARSLHRAREVAVRTSLGARRSRIVREHLVEALLLASAGGAAGLAVSWTGIRLFASAIPAGTLPYWIDYTMDVRTAVALVAVSLTTVAVFGLAPALVASRLDVLRVLKDGGRWQTTSGGARRWTAAFMTAQLALAVVLLSTVMLATLTARARLPSDAALATTSVTTAALTLPASRYASPDDRRYFFEGLLERVHNLPGITAAAMTSALPGTGVAARQLDIEGRSWPDDRLPTTLVVEITPGYFRALALAPARGRDLTELDGRPGHANGLVNERFVERFLQGQPPIGTRLGVSPPDRAAGPQSWVTVVGVVPDIRQRSTPDAEPLVYLPFASAPPASATLMVRSAQDPSAVAVLLRDAAQRLDARVPLYRIQTLAQVVHDAEWNPRVSARLAATLTMLCLLLATVGLYAVTSHGAGLRRNEFGIRMALGATPLRIARLVVAGVRVPLLLGLGFGLAGAIAWDRAFPSSRPALRASDPSIMALISLLIALVTMAACYHPARRAATRAPAEVLRQE